MGWYPTNSGDATYEKHGYDQSKVDQRSNDINKINNFGVCWCTQDSVDYFDTAWGLKQGEFRSLRDPNRDLQYTVRNTDHICSMALSGSACWVEWTFCHFPELRRWPLRHTIFTLPEITNWNVFGVLYRTRSITVVLGGRFAVGRWPWRGLGRDLQPRRCKPRKQIDVQKHDGTQ